MASRESWSLRQRSMRVFNDASGLGRLEVGNLGLKKAVVKLEAEKEAGLAQFYKLLKKVSELELQVVSTEEESQRLREQASNAVALEESYESIEDEKFSLEVEKDVLLSLVEGVTYDAVYLKKSLVDVGFELDVLTQKSVLDEKRVMVLEDKLRQTLDENELLELEKSVLVTLFGELRMDAAEPAKEREAVIENLNSESQKLAAVEIEAGKYRKMNDVLRRNEVERNEIEEKLKYDIQALNGKLSALQESLQNLRTCNTKLVQENMSLKKDMLELEQKNHVLDDELAAVETASEELSHQLNDGRDRELQLYKNLEAAQSENALLKNSIEVLKKRQDEIADVLKERVSTLEGENVSLRAQLHRIKGIEESTKRSISVGLTNHISEDLDVVDKLEISDRFVDSHQEENKRKMLERLESDGQKLTDLRKIVQDLKAKMEKIKHCNETEYYLAKKHLEEAEEGITMLSLINAKLNKTVEDGDDHIPSSPPSKLDDSSSQRMRKILDSVQLGAERLERLHMEVQKLQLRVLKLDSGEQEPKPEIQNMFSGSKFTVTDYARIRGKEVTPSGKNHSRKKSLFSRILPQTKKH